MNIQKLPITQLRPAPYNPRQTLKPGTPRFERLARSLSEFNLVQPLVWNSRTGHLVGGHQRLEVLRNRGQTEVECVVVDLPIEREQALNVALNNGEVGGDWDPQKLTSLLNELVELPGFDPTLTGFDERQIHNLLMMPIDCEEEDDEPEADMVKVALEIPSDLWPAAQVSLNRLLSDAPGIRLHVREAT